MGPSNSCGRETNMAFCSRDVYNIEIRNQPIFMTLTPRPPMDIPGLTTSQALDYRSSMFEVA